jgi:hypothetical protein
MRNESLRKTKRKCSGAIPTKLEKRENTKTENTEMLNRI